MMRFAYFVIPLVLAASMVAAAEMPVPNSILPPGMRSISITLTRDRPRREESKRAFIRRLLSSKGKGRLE